MATIKLNAEKKIITKSGKVSCTCCGGGECCMYPAQALADGLYTINDLPDEIVVQKTGNPITLQRGIGSSEPPQIPGAFYGSSDPNGNEDYVFLYNGFWEYGPGVPVCSQAPCLITDLCAKDQFADTYTVEYAILDPFGNQTVFYGTTTITRENLCVWTGIAGTIPISLKYQNLQWEMISAQGPTTKEGLGFANTPTGYYFTDEQEFTVS